jgi:hypothetical protein
MGQLDSVVINGRADPADRYIANLSLSFVYICRGQVPHHGAQGAQAAAAGAGCSRSSAVCKAVGTWLGNLPGRRYAPPTTRLSSSTSAQSHGLSAVLCAAFFSAGHSRVQRHRVHQRNPGARLCAVALSVEEDMAHTSLCFGMGCSTTEEEVPPLLHGTCPSSLGAGYASRLAIAG